MARNKALCCWSDHNHCRYLDFPDQSNRANAAIHFREGARSAVTPLGWRWIVDAHREGRRDMVHSDELLSAFLELEATLRERRKPGRSDRLRPSLNLHSFKRGIWP